MDDRIIDLGEYIRKRSEREEASSRSAFAVWGGEGRRSRFALPLWRAAYLVEGARASLVSEDTRPGGEGLVPLIVLDLGREPARTTFDPMALADVRGAQEAPAMGGRPGRELTVFLGEHEGRRWYLMVTELESAEEALSERVREDVFFLAGECAGLLFHRELEEIDPDA